MRFKTGILIIIILLMIVSPVLAAESMDQSENPWYWYNKAVDLANAGQFSEALVANEKALAINESIPLAWANEAGILVQLGRYEDAVTAADRVLSTNSTALPNTYAAAYYSKGDALRALGRNSEAVECYTQAYKLDSSLVPPNLSHDTPAAITSSTLTAVATTQKTVPVRTEPSTTKSPLPPAVVVGAVLAALGCSQYRRSG